MPDIHEKISSITNKDMDEMADALQKYISDFDRYIIKEGLSVEEYTKNKKTVKKLIKKLREHDRSVFRDED